ncbi:MAG: Spy/CpxP family protein refolding chaperone [Desulfobacterales bacterium]|jgi:protein CpxP
MNRSILKSKWYLMVIAAGILVLSAATGAQWVHARGWGHGGHGGGFGGLKMLMHLDLSDDQKTRIRDMLPAYRAEKGARQDALQAMRAKMRDLMEAERFDENEVRQAFREMAPLMEDMAVLRAQFMHDLKSILTPEQIDRVKEKHMNRESRRGEHRRIRESMLDTWLNTPSASASVQ